VASWNTGFAEFLESALTRISNATLRAKDGKGNEALRMDGVEYCRSALLDFKEMRPEEVQTVGIEIAQLGAQGIDPHDAEKRYSIESLSGREFTAMRALCYMFVAWKQFRPDVDVGFDVSREYEVAKGMAG